jgi:hypothetical protein
MRKLFVVAFGTFCVAILPGVLTGDAAAKGSQKSMCWEYGSFGWGYYSCAPIRGAVHATNALPPPEEPLCLRWDWPHGWGLFGCEDNVWRSPGWGDRGWF